jgi:hypothetical protein
MRLDKAKQILKKAGLIAEETTEDALARMATNSYEGQVDEIVETIEKVKHVKNYYEVDPDVDYVKAQFEIVMQDNTVWEVQFRKGHGFWWRGNIYPWRIIENNKGGFVQLAFSMTMLRSYLKKVKAIQSESVKTQQCLKKTGFLTEGATYQSFVNWLKAGYDKAVSEIEKYYDDGFEVEYMNGAIKESFNELYNMFEAGASVDELQKKLEYEYHNY